MLLYSAPTVYYTSIPCHMQLDKREPVKLMLAPVDTSCQKSWCCWECKDGCDFEHSRINWTTRYMLQYISQWLLAQWRRTAKSPLLLLNATGKNPSIVRNIRPPTAINSPLAELFKRNHRSIYASSPSPSHVVNMAPPYAEDEKSLDHESAYSHTTTVLNSPQYVPTLSSIPARLSPSQSRHDHTSFERTGSINITTGPTRVNPKAKIVGEFRTLRFAHNVICLRTILSTYYYSIHVTDTKEGRADYATKEDVKGETTRSLNYRWYLLKLVHQIYQNSNGIPNRLRKFAPS